ncbi:unnamed protein product [Tuber aestivum]|uniref:Defective in cullin neddylation protein n=1 Tax=Tuber aestivum TaxID=59557 RepID=A0A292Q3Q7_9PEZI|nr:unnamed protein product [Tuber aestivum]
MSYTSSQRSAIQQFIAFTACPERTAAKFLKSHSWDVEVAVDSYFTTNNSSSTMPSSADPALRKVFDQFREPGDPEDTMTVNGVMKFLPAIGVGLEEETVLVLAEALRAPTMGEFAREGFVEGWKALNCDTLDKMRARVPALRISFTNDEATFKKVYLFTYNFARSPNQRSLQMDTAIEYWKLLFTHRFQKNLEDWIEFLETEYKKSIAKDTWNCMYDFVQFADKDPELKSYDVDVGLINGDGGGDGGYTGAWPSILDDFVQFSRKKNGTEPSPQEEMDIS